MSNSVPENQAGPLVAQAVERMAAAKIALGLPPLVLLGAYGVVQWIQNGFQPSEPVVVVIGSLLSMVAMVAYGMQAVSRVLEKTSRWSALVFAGSFIPVLFGGYMIVTRTLNFFPTGGTGFGPVVVRVILLVLATMCMRAQWKLIEVHLLAREMAGVGRQ